LFKAGSGWAPPWDGNVDAFTIKINGNSITYDFETSSISQASALQYNSAKSNVANGIHEGVNDSANLLKEKEKEPSPTTSQIAKEIHVNVSIVVTQLKGSWDEVGDVPCDLRGGLGLDGCDVVPYKLEECGAIICQHDHPRD